MYINFCSSSISPSTAPHSSGLRVGEEGRTQVLQLHIPHSSSLWGSVCPLPVSVAPTPGISVDFFSWGY